jgi:hypothetical protein
MINKFIILSIIIFFVVFAYFTTNSEEKLSDNLVVYESERFGFQFSYRDGADGYVLEKIGEEGEFAEIIILIPTIDYQSIIRGEREGGEGPPTINIFVTNNLDDRTLTQWTMDNQQVTNVHLVTSDILETSVHGREAISYSADGLYPSRNIVINNGSLIFYFSGSYLEIDSAIFRDFQSIIDSLKFDSDL